MNSSILTRTAVTMGLAVALTGIAATVHADPSIDSLKGNVVVNHVRVHYGDLNLESDAGARLLLQRITNAATDACGGKPFGGPMALYVNAKSRFEACKDIAIRTAVNTVDRPTVTAAFEGKRATDSRTASR